MISRAVSRLVQTNKLSVVQKRTRYVLYQPGPPNYKLSSIELIGAGLVFLVGILGPSIYFSANMQVYNGKAAQRSQGDL